MMIKKILFPGIAILFYSYSYAQDKISLNNQDGVYVTYELTRIDSSSKKTSYLVVLTAENRNDFDLFYSIPLTKQTTASEAAGISGSKYFAQTSVKNSTGLFGDNILLTGNETKFLTNDNKILFSIPARSFVKAQKEFKVKSGNRPVFVNTFLFPLKKLDFFNIALSEPTVNGEWVSDCGHIQMTLFLSKDALGQTVIQQQVNGKQNRWVKVSDTFFEKSTDRTTTLSYNRQANTFTYFNTDGISCVWVRK